MNETSIQHMAKQKTLKQTSLYFDNPSFTDQPPAVQSLLEGVMQATKKPFSKLIFGIAWDCDESRLRHLDLEDSEGESFELGYSQLDGLESKFYDVAEHISGEVDGLFCIKIDDEGTITTERSSMLYITEPRLIDADNNPIDWNC